VAHAIAEGVRRWKPEAILVGLAGSGMLRVWQDRGFAVAPEIFADRRYEPDGSLRPLIRDHQLFEAVANNPHLPDPYKIVMVIRPGAQGGSEIVGEWPPTAHPRL
jgi:lactam utilization protein B